MNRILNIIVSNKKRIIGLLLLLVTVFLFVYNDAFLYPKTIVRITRVENVFQEEREGPNGEIEKYYSQQLAGKVLNGSHKGKEVEISNTYSSSGIQNERYYLFDQVFVTVDSGGKQGSILGKKRDMHLVMLAVVFLVLLFSINKKQGGLIFISLLINMLIFMFVLYRYGEGDDLVLLAFIMMLVFSVFTLLFAGGFHKKTLVAIISTVLTTLLCYGIYEIVVLTGNRIPYEMMDYVVSPGDLSDLFLTGVLMGSLGAVMDVSISIAAGVSEIEKTSPDITIADLVKSIREMGYDIMGTMISVLFFTYISGGIPLVIVKIKNGYTLYHLIHFHLIFEIIRFLMGAIGIVLAIPVAGFCSVLFLHSQSIRCLGKMIKENLKDIKRWMSIGRNKK